jgi:hypothetical protein
MTKYLHSKHGNTSNRKPRGVELARLTERRRIRRKKRRQDARLSKELKSKSSPMLLARSEELLTSLIENYGSTTTRHIFKDLLKANLTAKFRRMQRKHRQKALAVASTV